MKEPNSNPEDAKLGSLLRESRPSPSLPPRFYEGVWRRMERAEPGRTADSSGWLDALVVRVLRPKFATAVAVTLVLAGAVLGMQQGTQAARRGAQARYVAAVAPDAAR